MKYTNEELKNFTDKELRELRDQILKESGFRDIDKYDDDVIRPELIKQVGNLNVAVNETILQYYPFTDKTDRFIFQQYANGLSSREIESLLKTKKSYKQLHSSTIARRIKKILSVYGK